MTVITLRGSASALPLCSLPKRAVRAVMIYASVAYCVYSCHPCGDLFPTWVAGVCDVNGRSFGASLLRALTLHNPVRIHPKIGQVLPEIGSSNAEQDGIRNNISTPK